MRTNLLLSLLCLGCHGDDTSTTTFSTFVTTFSTMSSPSTNATAFDGEPTTDYAEPGSSSETTGFGHSETSAVGTEGTTGTSDDTSDDTGAAPVPPAGCAWLIEVLPRTEFANDRYVVIDMSRCPRAEQATLTFQAATPKPSSWSALVARRDCGVFGGNMSPAANPGEGEEGVVLSIFGTDDATDVLLRLEVDGEVSDELILPDNLKGQTWDGEPDAPVVPVRRREDFSWVPVVEHVPGCAMAPVF